MRSSLTAHDRLKHKNETHIKPLPSEFFDNLIKLETDIAQKKYTVESLDELMECYGQAVEYYDSIKDQISSYFIFKIQDILMTKKAMKVLMDESVKVAATATSIALNSVSVELIDGKDSREFDHTENAANSSQIIEQAPVSPNKSRVTFAHEIAPSNVIMETMANESSEEDDEEEKAVMIREKQRRITELNKRKKGLVKSLATMKNQKQKMFNLQLKLQSARIQDKQNLHEVLANFGEFSEDNDKVVRHDLDIQKMKIRSKLAKKRKDGFMNFTQSSHGFAQVRDIIENMTIESVLKGLDDDEDSAQSQEQDLVGFNNGNESAIEGIHTEMKKQTEIICNE